MAHKLPNITIGMDLPKLNKTVKQEHINLYAQASGDFNPIHLDPEFAKKMQLDGTIAHGMMVLAYISEYMAINFGWDWLTSGKLSARFKEPARPDDTVSISGKITNIVSEGSQTSVYSIVTCQNQLGQVIINSETKVRLTG